MQVPAHTITDIELDFIEILGIIPFYSIDFYNSDRIVFKYKKRIPIHMILLFTN